MPMTDLTNNILDLHLSQAEALLKRYASLLQSINPDEQLRHAYIFDYAIKFINANYFVINKIWKSWLIVVVKNFYPKITTESDVENIINDFLIYHNDFYENYCNELICNDNEERDYMFVYSFLNYKKTAV